ncbi:hypothetical protein [Rhodococcus jostii]|uniref:Oxidoreductase n=1 Tax=Rhodococcus jostii TaxID=132919 RepID=A0ABU4CP38_RHOJO|nr:hypothetical protein [Rhodococcus jostii]MDV6284965.1 hypothetical protein [Rhodococcus jostii]
MQVTAEASAMPDILSEKQWFKRLKKAATTGEVIDLGPDNEGPVLANPEHADLWRAGRVIPANAIRRVLTLPESVVKTFDPRGLQIAGARIDGDVDWSHISFIRPLHFDGCAFNSAVNLCNGRVTSLHLFECAITDLRLDEARIDGALFAVGLKAVGEIRAIGVHIGGALILTDATLTNPIGKAMHIDFARIEGALIARNLTTTGEICAAGVHIGGELGLTGATLTNLSGRPALHLYNAHIDGALFANRLTAIGEIRAIGVHISGTLILTDANLTSTNGDTLALTGATLRHLVLRPKRIRGPIRLELATIKTFSLPEAQGESEPHTSAFAEASMNAAGWSVTDFNGAIRRDWRVARSYLKRTDYPEFVPQPWFDLADVYDRAGHPDQARSLRLYAENQITGNTYGVTKAIRRIYAATVGYGYRPFLPVLWLLGVLVVAGFLIWTNQTQFLNVKILTPKTANDMCTDTSGYACFNTIGYTLQNVVPAASGPLGPDWVLSTSGWWPVTLGIVLAVLRLVAWGFAALTLAAMTGLLRKR